jgi:hypothetical protein
MAGVLSSAGDGEAKPYAIGRGDGPGCDLLRVRP